MGAGACVIDGNYKDDMRAVRIVLRNNVIAQSITAPPPAALDTNPRWARVFDGVYFSLLSIWEVCSE